MATIGRKRAVAQIGTFKVSGLVAWLLWSLAHIYFLIGFRNRLGCGHELVLELRDIPTWHPVDHRHFWLTY